MIVSSYLTKGFVKEYYDKVLDFFKEMTQEVDFDAIVVTGVSGLLLGPSLARETNKGLVVVRKQSESRHSSYSLEGHLTATKLVFVDDFIGSGRTFITVRTELSSRMHTQCNKIVGIFLWNESYTGVADREDFLELSAYSCWGNVEQDYYGKQWTVRDWTTFKRANPNTTNRA